MDSFLKDYGTVILSVLTGVVMTLWRFMNVFKEIALLHQRTAKLEHDLEKETKDIKMQMDRIEDKLDKYVYRELR